MRVTTGVGEAETTDGGRTADSAGSGIGESLREQAAAGRPRAPSSAAGFDAPDSTGEARGSTLAARFDESRRWLSAEVRGQRTRGFLWLPVALGIGAATYLGLKSEPPLWLAFAAAAVASLPWLAAARWSRSAALVVCAGLVAAAGAGFLLAKAHSDRVAAPIAPTGLGLVRINGWIVDIGSPADRGPRLLIAPTWIEGLAPGATPTRVRIVTPVAGGPESVPPPGTAVRLLALLDPPPGPASPGAYDFARDAWFEGVGGVGLAMRAPEIIGLPPPPARLRFDMAVNALRWRVAQCVVANIVSVMGESARPAAGLAAAVTTSHQDWLPPARRDDLRASGLAHMLAIAGLHTAAISGFAFFAVRLAIAAWPWLALRVPGKKVAAAAALAVVAGYLVLSGAHPPARRAAITASIAFLAIMVDRRAISLRSLALAAVIILLIEPDVVVAPGFEMSFCATASLVALAELWPRRAAAKDLPWPLALAQRARDALIALTLVSLVAGAATSPFAIQHFNRVANYGVFANLTADFIASAILMPMLAASLLAQALGAAHTLGAPFFWAAGWAARGVLALARVFAEAPGAAASVPSAPQVALAISYLGIVFACLWNGRLRWVGVAFGAAVAVWPRAAPPRAWLASDGDDAAVVVHGREVAMKPGMRLYATQSWAQRRGFDMAATADEAVADAARAFDCDRKGCIPIGTARPAIAGWWFRAPPSTERLRALCARADIFVTRADMAHPEDCPGAIALGPASFARGGSAEVFAAPSGWRLSWAQDARGRRPWTLSGSGE